MTQHCQSADQDVTPPGRHVQRPVPAGEPPSCCGCQSPHPARAPLHTGTTRLPMLSCPTLLPLPGYIVKLLCVPLCLMHKRDIHCGQTSWAGDFGVAVMRLPHVNMQDCLPMRAACSDVCIHALMCAYISTFNAVAARMICAAEILDEVMAHRPCMARSRNLCPSAVIWPFCFSSLNFACNEQHVDRYLS